MPATLLPQTFGTAQSSGRTLESVGLGDLFPLTVNQYHQMIDSDILTSDDRVELLSGILVKKMAKNPPHSAATTRLARRFSSTISIDWSIRCQEPITLMDGEPEPDFAIARGGLETYDSRHPEAKDVVLVVEIADSSLDRDRLDKQSMYAENRIPVYWVVNLVDGIVHSYSDPTGPSHSPRYQTRNDFDQDLAIPIVLDGHVAGTIRASDILV